MDITISEAKDSQVLGILELWEELVDFHSNIDPYFTRSEDSLKVFEKYVRDLIEKETTQVLVALHRDRVVAYSIAEAHQRPPFFEQKECGLISDLAVKSSYRRKGIGEKLLQEMLKWFAARGLHRIELRVLSANEVGYNFWKKQGFRDYMHILYLDVS